MPTTGPEGAPEPRSSPPDRPASSVPPETRPDDVNPPRAYAGSAWWAETQEITLPWEERFTVRQRRPGRLRLPGPDDPAPAVGRLVGVCAWAAVLALVGLVIAARALLIMLGGEAPAWYEPTVITAGLVGMTLTTGAFLTIQHAHLPWVLLAGATVPLLVNVTATVTAP